MEGGLRREDGAMRKRRDNTDDQSMTQSGHERNQHGDPGRRGLPTFRDKYAPVKIKTEQHANTILRDIRDGDVGFDTESTDRRPTREERSIVAGFGKGTAARRAALLGWQIVELSLFQIFPVAWDHIGLRLLQIARGNDMWVLDMWKIRGEDSFEVKTKHTKNGEAFPAELRRILLSPDIRKIGVGLSNDILVIWDDLRIDMRNLTDAGLMAKLVLAEKYSKTAYGNLSLKSSVEDVLGYELSKELSNSDWSAKDLTDDQIKYAGIDAIAALRLYEVLKPQLERKSKAIEQHIPDAWYRFNSKSGEPIRLKQAPDGGDIPWRVSTYVDTESRDVLRKVFLLEDAEQADRAPAKRTSRKDIQMRLTTHSVQDALDLRGGDAARYLRHSLSHEQEARG
ncbi:ribonuclease H-like domain-containing protein [Mycena latifolia]|nr:ribonuclease H-like domain-containing protein [Mycena latifolia]